jgi:low affinity Fe/Cu permease
MPGFGERCDKTIRRITDALGTRWALGAAAGVVIVWALAGPLLGFSEAWQLAINTGTTIVTFLLVFVLQHTQNVDTTALHAKLDEILRAMPEADDALRGIEREVDE